MDLDKIVAYMKEKHAGQKRRNGIPYHTHPIHVAYILRKKGFPTEYQIAALLHDVLEDTDATYDEILTLTTPEIAEAVKLVTKEPGYNMLDYINRINKNPMAKAVKLADRVHNLSETHLISDLNFKKKYLEESRKWFPGLAKGTVFEEEMNFEIQKLSSELEKGISFGE